MNLRFFFQMREKIETLRINFFCSKICCAERVKAFFPFPPKLVIWGGGELSVSAHFFGSGGEGGREIPPFFSEIETDGGGNF